MKELLLTHDINGMANVVNVDYDRLSATVKRVPSSSPKLKSLLKSGKIRKCYSELRDDSDIWLMDVSLSRGWLSVTSEGVVRNTLSINKLETDDAAFLASFVELPANVIKSKVFVTKLSTMGKKVALRNSMAGAVCELSPEVSKAFSGMLKMDLQAPESEEVVTQLEVWGHTLNRLYGSNTELLDPDKLSTFNWLRPKVHLDTVLWRGLSDTEDKCLNVYLKGDTVLYVGFHTLVESEYHRHTQSRELREVLTYENLLTPTCEGLLYVAGDYLFQALRDKPASVRVCDEKLPQDELEKFEDFLYESMVLIDVMYEDLINASQIQKSWLYDVVNNKIYVFKETDSGRLGCYYGEMTVEEWRERRDNYIGTR